MTLLAPYTTLELGGDCAEVVTAQSTAKLIEAVTSADSQQLPLLLIAGGSNVVIGDAGWPGRTVLIRTQGIEVSGELVTAAAGEVWDDFARQMTHEGRAGVEALVGIPGAVGATPFQNVGAYGQEVADTIVSVQVWDRQQQQMRTLTASECKFSYRHSVFKDDPHRYLILAVQFRLPVTAMSTPIRYGELAQGLGVAVGEQADLVAVSDAVLALRASKGMVRDLADRDTYSAGSFFTNPILTAAAAASLPAAAPRFPVANQPDRVKTSAAWLIENAGIHKGFALTPESRVRVSTKHTLALTNRGAASTSELLELAEVVRQRVLQSFGVLLEPEPLLINCSLPRVA